MFVDFFSQRDLAWKVENEQGIWYRCNIVNEYRNEFITHNSATWQVKLFENETLRLSEMCVESSSSCKTDDFTEEELDKAISKLKSGKAWPDNFPPEVFSYSWGERN